MSLWGVSNSETSSQGRYTNNTQPSEAVQESVRDMDVLYRNDIQPKIHYDVDAVKDRLVRYQENERDIEIQQERYERLRTKLMSYGVSGMSDMPRDQSFVTDKVAETIAKAVDIENSLKTAISNQKKEREALESIIVNLKSSNERAVIRTRYFDSMSWQEVSELIFGMEEDFIDRQESYERRVFKIHGSALLNMAIYQHNEQHYYDTHPDGF